MEGKNLKLASKESAAMIMASASSLSFTPTWRRCQNSSSNFDQTSDRPTSELQSCDRNLEFGGVISVLQLYHHLSLVVGLDMLVANLFERAVVNRRLTTLRTALLQQEQESEVEIELQERQSSPTLQEEHNLDILSSPLRSLN